MPKRHKNKAKGKQQNNTPKRKSLNDSFRSQSLRSQGSGAGFGNAHFSLRDELQNTERHHQPWSPNVKLRHQTISFVSAGTIQPLEEPKIEEGGSIGEVTQNTLQAFVKDDYLDSELDNSDGALAHMNLQSSTELSEAEITGEEEDGVDDMVVDTVIPAMADAQSTFDGTADEDIFIVDTVGDKSLASHTGRKPQIRSHSPTPSNSSEEVVLFRGRTDHVTVREDPAVITPASSSRSKKSQSQQPQTDASHVTDTLLDLLGEPLQSQPEPASSRELVIQEAPRERLQRPVAPPWPIGPLEAQNWVHSDGTRSKPSNFPSVRQQEPEVDMLALKAPLAGSRKGKKGRRGQNRQLRRLQKDLEDELVQDYIANMSDAENHGISQRPLGGEDDDWLSSEMDEEEEDVEDGVDETFAALLAEDDDDSSEPSDVSDDYDSDEDDGESGDDSELEAAIALAERENWEDDADLRQRQRDAMTDEEIARILEKQESMGMGGDELFLFDDSGFGDVDDARAGLTAFANTSLRGSPSTRNRNSNGMKRGKGRKSDNFPSASLMAEVIEQDPYGGFDVMDFDRPSLKRKAKGRKSAGALPEELLDLSDEDLLENIQTTWSNDRNKKAARKAEREELRMMGLLGSGKKGKKGIKNQPDLRQKYLEGITLNQIRDEIRDFLEVEVDNTTKAFPPMEKFDRKILHEIAGHFNIKSKSQGGGKNRFTILIKTQRTLEWSEQAWHPIVSRASKGFLGASVGRGKKNARGGSAAAGGAGPRPLKRGGAGGGGNAAGGYRNGEVVGGTAPEIAETNFGRKLMEKMGWSRGMALGKEGAEGRLLVPVAAVIKSGKAGLG